MLPVKSNSSLDDRSFSILGSFIINESDDLFKQRVVETLAHVATHDLSAQLFEKLALSDLEDSFVFQWPGFALLVMREPDEHDPEAFYFLQNFRSIPPTLTTSRDAKVLLAIIFKV